MKPLKTLGGLLLTSSALFLVTSCTKNVDEQFAKGDSDVSKLVVPACQPFVGLQVKQNNAANTYVFYGKHNTPVATQAFWGSDFSATNLLAITATGGTPFHRNDWNYIGVTDAWINGAEVLSMKFSGMLAGKASNKMQMQVRTLNLTGSADFYLAGVMVGSLPIASTVPNAQEIQTVVYNAAPMYSDFDEVRFSVTAGYMALTAYTPTYTGLAGQSGFYMVEAAGQAVVGRFLTGTTVIDGLPRVNQYFTWENGYSMPVADIQRQNRNSGTDGEFPAGAWVGAKHWVNISGSDGNGPSPLVWGAPLQMRLGVGDAILSGTEVVTITPGADFPATKFRSVTVRQASISSSQLILEVWNGMTLVGSATSTGADQEYTTVTPGVDFDKVTVRAGTGTNLSIGRIDPGPLSATIKLYPACP